MTTWSCKDYAAKIKIKNEVSNVILSDIAFGQTYLTYQLLPGQSHETTMNGREDKWPKSGNISFIMSSNDSQIYLVTDSVYVLDRDDYLDIVIDDDTPVTSF